MKHFWPVMTYLSPFLTARVRMDDTSEPAPGSVRQNEANLSSSHSIPRYFFLTSSEPASSTGAEARPLAPSEVVMPEQPQESSSSIRHPSRKPRPGPPYSSGTCVFINPTSCAFWKTSIGQVPSLSYSQATERISFSAKSWASSRRFFCSSVSVKSTTSCLLEQGKAHGRTGPVGRWRLTGQSMTTPKAYWRHAPRQRTIGLERSEQEDRRDREGHEGDQDQAPLVGPDQRPAGRERRTSKPLPHASTMWQVQDAFGIVLVVVVVLSV